MTSFQGKYQKISVTADYWNALPSLPRYRYRNIIKRVFYRKREIRNKYWHEILYIWKRNPFMMFDVWCVPELSTCHGECQYIFKLPSVSGLQMAHFVKAGTKRKPQEMLKNGTNRLNKLQISIDCDLIGNEYLLKFLTYFGIFSGSDIPFNTIWFWMSLNYKMPWLRLQVDHREPS